MADVTTEILIEIRDEIRATRTDLSTRIDETNARLDQTNGQLDQTNTRLDRVERRQTAGEVRLSTEIVAVVGAIRELRDAIVEDRDLRGVVLSHEQRIARLEARS
jgi:hypothetical protein